MTALPRVSLRKIVLKLVRLFKRVSVMEKVTLAMTVLSASMMFAFAALSDQMVEGDTHEFDRRILLALRDSNDLSNPIGPQWLQEVMRDFTALGGMAVLIAVTIAAVGYLLISRRRHLAWFIAGSVISGIALSTLLKLLFDRDRPDLVPHISHIYTQSFPSGHAMLSAIVYLTLGALLARTETNPRIKAYLLGVAASATIIVGLSRIYLGVHWPSDVLAGWAIGAGWAMICWLITLWLQGEGKIEPEIHTRGPEVADQD